MYCCIAARLGFVGFSVFFLRISDLTLRNNVIQEQVSPAAGRKTRVSTHKNRIVRESKVLTGLQHKIKILIYKLSRIVLFVVYLFIFPQSLCVPADTHIRKYIT